MMRHNTSTEKRRYHGPNNSPCAKRRLENEKLTPFSAKPGPHAAQLPEEKRHENRTSTGMHHEIMSTTHVPYVHWQQQNKTAVVSSSKNSSVFAAPHATFPGEHTGKHDSEEGCSRTRMPEGREDISLTTSRFSAEPGSHAAHSPPIASHGGESAFK